MILIRYRFQVLTPVFADDSIVNHWPLSIIVVSIIPCFYKRNNECFKLLLDAGSDLSSVICYGENFCYSSFSIGLKAGSVVRFGFYLRASLSKLISLGHSESADRPRRANDKLRVNWR